ncbi:MAG: hypothetical protein M1456_01805 [Actinobacteria bacterium]|nr:hypothetical protein [Actinomycetota bacterium]MCL5885560.1 hypothetical protein [Actinomycetota bacterium]
MILVGVKGSEGSGSSREVKPVKGSVEARPVRRSEGPGQSGARSVRGQEGKDWPGQSGVRSVRGQEGK